MAPTKHARFKQRFGPAAVVTGASSGIGLAFAEELAARGFDLLLVARSQVRLNGVRDRLAATHGVAVRSLSLDLASAEACREVVRAGADPSFGLLVAAAGFGTSGPGVASVEADEEEMLAVNCGGTIRLALPFAKRFASAGRGGIVLMGSLVGFQGVPNAAHYAATKAYVQTLAEGLHHELKARGVAVVSCAPGPVSSGFAERAGMRMSMAQSARSIAAPTLDALGRRCTVRPGFLSNALELALKPLPRVGRVRMMGVIMRGMTEHRSGPGEPPTNL